jgi:hypothetical protein
MATARTKLEVVATVAEFMQPWEELLERTKGRVESIATLSEEDEQKFYEAFDQARNATKTDERVR